MQNRAPRCSASSMLILLALGLALAARADEMQGARDGTFFAASPLFGWDRNELKVRGPMGAESTETDTSPMYGFFAVWGSPHVVLNNFYFATDVNEADVMGNLFFANVYGDPEAGVTWNVGGGYLYHEIEPAMEDIKVTVPMVKAGPVFRCRHRGVMVNPYVGYAWERVDTRHGDQDNDSYLYGLSLGWHWRMVTAALKYYFQDSQEIDEDFDTFRAHVNVGLTKHWGFTARLDYMEHQTTEDRSILLGPSCVF